MQRIIKDNVTIEAKKGDAFEATDYVRIKSTEAFILLEAQAEEDNVRKYRAIKYYAGDHDHPMRPDQVTSIICLDKDELYGWCKTKPASEFKAGDLLESGIAGEKLPVEGIVGETDETVTLELSHHPSESEYYNNRSTHERTYLKKQRLAVGLNYP